MNLPPLLPLINLKAIDEMARNTPYEGDWKAIRPWLTSASKIESFAENRENRVCRREADIEIEDVEKLVKLGHAREVREADCASYLHIFPVFEMKEKVDGSLFWRRRPIKHPEIMNSNIQKTDMMGVKLPTRRQQDHQSLHGQLVATVDFAAWFDQIPLDAAVQKFFAFTKNGRFFLYCKLPMGVRYAVDIAETIARIIAHVNIPGIMVATNVDNTRFVGNNQEDMILALETYHNRCIKVNALLNENISDAASRSAAIRTKANWLGVEVDHIAKSRRLIAKTILKTEKSWSIRNSWSNRGIAAHLSLLLYGSRILNVGVGQFFAAMRYYRQLASLLTTSPTAWDNGAVLPACVWEDLQRWTSIVLENKSTGIMTRPQREDVTIFTDASAKGWGAVCVDHIWGTIRTTRGLWPLDFKEARHSTRAEPRAMLLAAREFIPHDSKKHYRFYTDSVTAKSIYTKGYADYFLTNGWASLFHSEFNNVNIQFSFIKGTLNTHADDLSRGVNNVCDMGELLRIINSRDSMGDIKVVS